MNSIQSIYWLMSINILSKHTEHYSINFGQSTNSIRNLIFRPPTILQSEIIRLRILQNSNINFDFWNSNDMLGVVQMTENDEFNMHSQWYFNYMMEVAEIPLYLPRALCRDFMQSEAAIKDFNKELTKHEAGFLASPEVFYT